MLKANSSHVKGLDLHDFRSALKNVDWKSFRDVDLMTHMRRDCDAERRKSAMLAAVGAAAVGAVFMYLFDPGLGESRRSSARERLKHWYLSGRGQLPRLLELYRHGRLPIDRLLGRRYRLAEINEAYRALLNGEFARAVIVAD